jgi:hypothetical protein
MTLFRRILIRYKRSMRGMKGYIEEEDIRDIDEA